jgi:two-component system OmpR family response regulator
VKKILIVEDDAALMLGLTSVIGDEGYEPHAARTGPEGLRLAKELKPDLIVLDIMLPGEDGLAVCRRIASAETGPPIIMLSAMGEDTDRIVGLELGADDYLAKPCNPRELLARIRAVLRRAEARASAGPGVGASCEFAGWALDLVRRELRSPQGVVVNLSSGEFSLLRVFVERPQRVLTRDQLLELARGPDSDAFDRAIDVQISRLRRKLDDGGGGQDLIRTIRNEGYMFTAKVKRT